tara:strand:+ start:812 stop:1051 length:240 start_codon:yes stop_codon:yes gene_type:complete
MKCVTLYNIRILRENSMTDSQFELFLMHGGMMSEGLKSNEALAFIVRSELATPEDVAWLVEKNAYSAAAAKVAKEKLDG